MDVVSNKSKGSFNSLVPSNWIAAFLESRKLDSPDGRALFAYQVDQQEFHHIAKCLSYSAALGIQNIETRLPKWDALFVLYASEWWRRNYHGGAWSWESIITSLDLSTSEFNHTTIRNIVSKGLKKWKRDLLKNSQGRQYLGTVIFEGGIPLGLLKQQSGFEGYLRGVLKDSIQYAEAGFSPVEFAQKRMDMLAKAYHKEEFLSLVGEVIQTVIRLRESHDLSAQKDPVSHLNRALPSWRTLFPISVEGDEGNDLINSLIVQSSKVKKKSDVPIYLTRRLQRMEDVYSLKNILNFPKVISESDLQDFWQLDTLGNQLDIVAINGSNKVTIAVLSLCRSEEYKVSPLIHTLPVLSNNEDWQVCFYRKGKAISKVHELKGGEVIEPDLPQGFEQTKDNYWNYICQGNVSTSKDKMRVILPLNGNLSSNSVTNLGEFEDCRIVCEIENNSTFEVDKSEIYQFKIKLETVPSNVLYRIWSEKKLLQKNTSIAVIIGAPRITKIIGDSLYMDVPSSNIYWRTRGGRWSGDLASSIGDVDIGIFEEHKLVYRKKVVILPRDLAISYNSHSEQFNRGEIIFSSQYIRSVSTSTDGVTYSVEDNNNGLCLNVCTENENIRTLNVLLDIYGCSNPVNVEFPFPSSGGRFIDADGNQLKDGALTTLDELNLIQLEIQHNNPNLHQDYYIDFSLVSKDSPVLLSRAKSSLKLVLDKEPLTDSLNLIKPLIDLQLTIKRLFSLSEDLDAYVDLSVRSGANKLGYMHVVCYSSSLESEQLANGSSLYLSDLEGVSLADHKAVAPTLTIKPLHFPEERGFELKPFELNGLNTNQWMLPNLSKHNGPWLVYEAKINSKIRPKLVVVTDLEQDEQCSETLASTLRKAIAEGSFTERRVKLDEAIDNLANDPNHKDWQIVDAYVAEFNLLPLTTFALWERFIKNDLAMAQIYFRYIDQQDKTHYIDNFSQELPFIWECVSPKSWQTAFLQKKSQLEQALNLLPDGHMLLVKQCLSWLETLSHLCVTSNVIVKSLKHSVLGQKDKLFTAFSGKGAAQVAHDFLMSRNDESHYQQLVRRNSEESWPSLTDELTNRLVPDKNPKAIMLLQLLIKDLPKWRSSVVLTPILLGIYHASNEDIGVINSALDIHSVRNVMRFDKSWFKTAYLVGYVYALGQ